MDKTTEGALRKADRMLDAAECDRMLTGLRAALDRVIAPALSANIHPCPERREYAGGVEWGYADPEEEDGFRYVFGMVAYPGQEPGCACEVFGTSFTLPISQMLPMF
ncbi:MAG: hypothetical protein LBT40_12840, partial [Deltaproteobacteria bacterium]|nr:hypothetical protein [Deltaproteobacteria bacterium]